MPPHCLVTVRAFCAQELKVEDLSYCFRIPASFVPAYLGNSSCSLMVEQTEKYKSTQEMAKVDLIPAKTNWLGLWDLEIRLKGQGTFERLCSLNHPIRIQLAQDKKQAIISLKRTVDRSIVPCEDFVLYIRDDKISQPTAICSITPSRQQALSIRILPDLRSEAEKSRVRQQIRSRRNSSEGIDTENNVNYQDEDEKESVDDLRSSVQSLQEKNKMGKKFSIWGSEKGSRNCKEFIILFHRTEAMQN